MFLANLGGIGLDRAFHHLYEWGTASLFGVVGAVHKTTRVDAEGVSRIQDSVDVCWTFDERIHDGFYCATSLARLRRYIEHPETLSAAEQPWAALAQDRPSASV